MDFRICIGRIWYRCHHGCASSRYLGKKADAKYFAERAQSYRKYFDPKTGFMRGARIIKFFKTIVFFY